MRRKIIKYIKSWKGKGYPTDIPDEVPEVLARRNLAPCYKSIALAILKNDHSLKSLGITPPKSEYYNALKRIELEERNK